MEIIKKAFKKTMLLKSRNKMFISVFFSYNLTNQLNFCLLVHPVDTGRKLNVHKTFRKRQFT